MSYPIDLISGASAIARAIALAAMAAAGLVVSLMIAVIRGIAPILWSIFGDFLERAQRNQMICTAPSRSVIIERRESGTDLAVWVGDDADDAAARRRELPES